MRIIRALRRNSADSPGDNFGRSVATAPFAPTTRGNDIATASVPAPSTQLTVKILCSSFIMQRNKSAVAAPMPSHVAPRPRIISYAELRTRCVIVLRVVWGKDIFIWRQKSSSFNAPTATDVQSTTLLSPCSPKTYALIECVDTDKWRDNIVRKRAESSIVPVPITRDAGRRDNLCANITMTSNGLDSIIILTVLASTFAITRGMISDITFALFFNKSMRVSPGFWFAPAAIITISLPRIPR